MYIILYQQKCTYYTKRTVQQECKYIYYTYRTVQQIIPQDCIYTTRTIHVHIIPTGLLTQLYILLYMYTCITELYTYYTTGLYILYHRTVHIIPQDCTYYTTGLYILYHRTVHIIPQDCTYHINRFVHIIPTEIIPHINVQYIP